MTEAARTQQHMSALSRLVFQGYAGDFASPAANLEPLYSDLHYVSSLSESDLADFLRLAEIHHVTVRALQVLHSAAAAQSDSKVLNWCGASLAAERKRIAYAVEALQPVCKALELAKCRVTV